MTESTPEPEDTGLPPVTEDQMKSLAAYWGLDPETARYLRDAPDSGEESGTTDPDGSDVP